MAELDGKVAVVTGGASGIGEATVRQFVEEGAKVVIADMQQERGQNLADELGDAAVFVAVEVRQEEQIKAAIDTAVENWSRLDCIFNNAGFGGVLGPVEDIPVEEFDMSFDVLVRGVFLGMKHAIPIMKKQGSGSIINTGSIAAVTAGRGPLIYSVCKAAVVQLSKVTAMSLGEHSIRVNAICPGYIATPLSTNTVGRPDEKIEERLQGMEHQQPILVSAARKTLPTWRSISPATDPLSSRAKPSWSTAGPRLVCSGKTRKTSTRISSDPRLQPGPRMKDA